jgi:DNA-binding IclR family transcriptional regulator
MAAYEIPDGVRRLIAERIDSIPELEAVLLLREYRGREWTATEAGQRLYVSKAVAAHILNVLEERGFFARNGQSYRYGPASTDLETTVEELVQAYSHHLVAVTQLVHAKPSPSVREFADAFRFRKSK